MAERPKLDPDQHRMLQHLLDLAWEVGSDDTDESWPHQRDAEMAEDERRRPDRDHAGAAIARKADDNQRQPEHRDQHEQPFVGRLAQSRDPGGAQRAATDKDVPAQKNYQTEDQDR